MLTTWILTRKHPLISKHNVERSLPSNSAVFACTLSTTTRDKLPKIRPLLNALLLRFTEVDASSQNLSLDETPIMFKGRVQLRQFLPLKRSRFGLKGFIVADSATGYVLNTMIYTGKEGPAASKNLAMREVLWLMEPFVDKGYRLYVDNWLSSIPLFFRS